MSLKSLLEKAGVIQEEAQVFIDLTRDIESTLLDIEINITKVAQ